MGYVNGFPESLQGAQASWKVRGVRLCPFLSVLYVPVLGLLLAFDVNIPSKVFCTRVRQFHAVALFSFFELDDHLSSIFLPVCDLAHNPLPPMLCCMVLHFIFFACPSPLRFQKWSNIRI